MRAVISFNNLRERGLERFTNPQNPVEMLCNSHTKISKHYYTPHLGGDMALVRGVVKELLALNKASIDNGESGIFDSEFLRAHTQGLEDYLTLVEETSWEKIVEQSGVSRIDIEPNR